MAAPCSCARAFPAPVTVDASTQTPEAVAEPALPQMFEADLESNSLPEATVVLHSSTLPSGLEAEEEDGFGPFQDALPRPDEELAQIEREIQKKGLPYADYEEVNDYDSAAEEAPAPHPLEVLAAAPAIPVVFVPLPAPAPRRRNPRLPVPALPPRRFPAVFLPPKKYNAYDLARFMKVAEILSRLSRIAQRAPGSLPPAAWERILADMHFFSGEVAPRLSVQTDMGLDKLMRWLGRFRAAAAMNPGMVPRATDAQMWKARVCFDFVRDQLYLL